MTRLHSEPTSVTKSTKILDAVQSLLKNPPVTLPGQMHRSPITYISPNLLELEQIYAKLESNLEVNSTLKEWWWNVIDDLGLGQDYQSQLAILATQPTSNNIPTADSSSRLNFLTEKGAARMAVQLLPFFQHLIIKCGQAGDCAHFRDYAHELTPIRGTFGHESSKHTGKCLGR